MTVKSIACNAIKIQLRNERVAEFIAHMKRANRPNTFWLGIKGAEECSQWAFLQ